MIRSSQPRIGARRVTGTVVAALTAASFPVFLTGALQGRIGEELGVGAGAIGSAIAVFFLAGAAASLPGGRLVDRIGAPRALRLGMGITLTASTWIALGADRPWRLVVGLLVAGTALSLVDTGGARALSRSVRTGRQGLAFGAKEASIPLASLLAGLVLPVLGVQLGWRPAFAGGAVLALLVAITVPSALERGSGVVAGSVEPAVSATADSGTARTGGAGSGRVARTASAGTARTATGPAHGTTAANAEVDADAPRTRTAGPRTVPLLVGLAVAAALAGSVAAAVASFLVPTAVHVGTSAALAGVVLSVASMTSVVARIGAGWSADRRPGTELFTIAGLAGAGSLGVAGLALASGPGAGLADTAGGGPAVLVTAGVVLAAALAMGAGWGWTGLVFLAAVRLEPGRPALAAGAVLAGLGVGGASGPSVLGLLAERAGFGLTWTVGAAGMLAAAAVAASLAGPFRRHHAGPG